VPAPTSSRRRSSPFSRSPTSAPSGPFTTRFETFAGASPRNISRDPSLLRPRRAGIDSGKALFQQGKEPLPSVHRSGIAPHARGSHGAVKALRVGVRLDQIGRAHV